MYNEVRVGVREDALFSSYFYFPFSFFFFFFFAVL